MSDASRPSTDADSCVELAAMLWSAWQSGVRVEVLPEELHPRSVDTAWVAQRQLSAMIGPTYGWKIAATSPAGQAHIGVDEPLPGPLNESFLRSSGENVPSDALHMRVVEAEFAFRLGRDVREGASPDDVMQAVDALHLAIEIPDSRFSDFEKVGGPALLADCACAGYFVLGPEVQEWRDDDLSLKRTEITINGETAARGGGAAVLGDPRRALIWLAQELDGRGSPLCAGDVVTTGTTTIPPAIGPGDEVCATFDGYGQVRVQFAR